jgi:hypothetical protein
MNEAFVQVNKVDTYTYLIRKTAGTGCMTDLIFTSADIPASLRASSGG